MAQSVYPDGFKAYFDAWEAKIGAFIQFKADLGAAPAPSDPTVPAAAVPAPAGVSAAAASHPELRGLPFAVKDNIAVAGFGLTCGSKLLENFVSPYSATAVRRLEAAGALPAGKTNMDEFGMGSSTDDSALKRTNNPWDSSRVAGGSSGGSAAAVAAGLVPFALGSDTGGSVRQPAAFCGVPGLKPTYGAVSRFGLVAYASSLETIGILGDSVRRIRSVFSVIRHPDPLDQTTLPCPADAPPLERRRGKPAATIGVLSPEAVARAVAALETDQEASRAALLEPEVEKAFRQTRERLQDLGYRLVEVELPSLKYGVPAYYTIATAEASANLARFDGIRYGARPDYAENPDELIDKARSAGLGAEVKLRILLGTFVLRSGFQDRYYLRAQRIRAGIRRDFDRVLVGKDACDAILMPVYPTRAFGRGSGGLSPFAQKAADLYTCGANLAGLPALAFPAGLEGGLPVGVQLVGKAFAEGTLLDLAEDYETAYPLPRPPAYRSFWS